MKTRAIPNRHGWTLYDPSGDVIGWVRRTEDDATGKHGPPGDFWTIPRVGYGDPATYLNVRHAAQSPFLPKPTRRRRMGIVR